MVRELFRFLFKYKTLVLRATLPLSLILLLGFSFLLVGHNLQKASAGYENRYALEIFLKSETSPGDIDSLKSFLRLQPGYDRLELVSQERALRRMTSILGEDPTRVLGYNPLPMSVMFFPNDNYKNIAYLEMLKQQVEELPMVEKGIFAGEWLQELEKFNALFVKATAIFMLLVLFAYIFLLQMTLNHLWLRYQETAGKLHLLGMPRLVIRFPVYIWSALLASLSILLSLLVLSAATNFVSRSVMKLYFFQPEQMTAIAITFMVISVLTTVFKRMKIPTYE